jgi:hypothetical protein
MRGADNTLGPGPGPSPSAIQPIVVEGIPEVDRFRIGNFRAPGQFWDKSYNRCAQAIRVPGYARNDDQPGSLHRNENGITVGFG